MRPIRNLSRVIVIVCMIALIAFSIVGILAGFEVQEASTRIAWQAGYGVLGIFCSVALILLLLRFQRND